LEAGKAKESFHGEAENITEVAGESQRLLALEWDLPQSEFVCQGLFIGGFQ
jgi:hypothetical protein